MTANDHHDWHSETYVEEWLASDVTKDASRRVVFRSLLDGPVRDAVEVDRALDVGGGYGLLTREVLEAFPHSTVALQDFSEPMLERSRSYLAQAGDRVERHVADLRDAGWSSGITGPFDLAVSALAIHNVRDASVCAAIYAEIGRLVRPGGVFLDVDFVGEGDSGGGPAWTMGARLGALDHAGFADAEEVWRADRLVALLARR